MDLSVYAAVLRLVQKQLSILMRRSIAPGGVARQLNGQPFTLLAPCHARASTPEKGNLFLHKP